MGSDESHFNVSLIVRHKVTRQCSQTSTFEEKGEPKQIRTEVPLLTSLTPYRWAKSAHGKFVIGPSNIYCLQACMCTLLGPEILQAGAVKGLMTGASRFACCTESLKRP